MILLFKESGELMLKFEDIESHFKDVFEHDESDLKFYVQLDHSDMIDQVFGEMKSESGYDSSSTTLNTNYDFSVTSKIPYDQWASIFIEANEDNPYYEERLDTFYRFINDHIQFVDIHILSDEESLGHTDITYIHDRIEDMIEHDALLYDDTYFKSVIQPEIEASLIEEVYNASDIPDKSLYDVRFDVNPIHASEKIYEHLHHKNGKYYNQATPHIDKPQDYEMDILHGLEDYVVETNAIRVVVYDSDDADYVSHNVEDYYEVQDLVSYIRNNDTDRLIEETQIAYTCLTDDDKYALFGDIIPDASQLGLNDVSFDIVNISHPDINDIINEYFDLYPNADDICMEDHIFPYMLDHNKVTYDVDIII